MRRIQYQKTQHGPVIVSDEEVTQASDETTLSAIARYNALFTDVPLWGGREWRRLTIDALAGIFHAAVAEGLLQCEREQQTAIAEHASRSWLRRMIRQRRGWQAPLVPTRAQLLQEMEGRCLRLADWMESNQSRRFYAASDMSDFITKPRAVAAALREERSR